MDEGNRAEVDGNPCHSKLNRYHPNLLTQVVTKQYHWPVGLVFTDDTNQLTYGCGLTQRKQYQLSMCTGVH